MSNWTRILTVSIGIACAITGAAGACGGPGTTGVSASATGSGGSAGSGATGGGSSGYASSPCGTCVQEQCSAQWTACESDPECASYIGCLMGCPIDSTGDADPACVDQCPKATSSSGKKAKADLDVCRAQGAGATCPACGKIEAPSDPIFSQVCGMSSETNPCWICEDESCCETYLTCHNDAECHDIVTCVQSCPDSPMIDACFAQCYSAHPASYPAFGDKQTCLRYHCGKACGAAPSACDECTFLYCADEDAACARDLDCTLLFFCEVPCGLNTTCYDACEAMFPSAAVDLLRKYEQCGTDHCANVCQGE